MTRFPALGQLGFVLPAERAVRAQAYEAGGTTGSRGRAWRTSGAGPNASVTQNLGTIRTRARGAVRNDPWAKKAIASLVTNAIGTGIVPHPEHPDPDMCTALKELWRDWVPEADADGLLDFYGLQTLAARSLFTDGEVLNRTRPRRPERGLCVPLQVQLFEADHLPANLNQMLPNGGEIVSGVEFDRDGDRVAYHLHRRHPGEAGRATTQAGTVRVPAAEIQHVFEPVRPGAVRGCSSLATVLLRLHTLDSFDDAVLVRQEVANLFAGFITRPAPTSIKLDMVTGHPAQFDGDGTVLTSMEPGSLQELLPGEEVQFAEPPGAGTDYGPFMRQQLMAAAASVGLPYEVLTGDLRDVSDRALRVILGEFRRQLEQLQWNVFIHQYCRPVWAAWTDAVALSGVLPMPNYYRDRRLYLRVRWVPQGWPYINPLQDVQAQRIAIRAGLASRSATILAQGEDPETTDAEYAADFERADRLGLVFDSDARQRDMSGDATDTQEHTNDES